MATHPPSIEVRGLTRRYGKAVAVEQLSFAVQPGRVTGLVGPNGAGKSTTLRMILGGQRYPGRDSNPHGPCGPGGFKRRSGGPPAAAEDVPYRMISGSSGRSSAWSRPESPR